MGEGSHFRRDEIDALLLAPNGILDGAVQKVARFAKSFDARNRYCFLLRQVVNGGTSERGCLAS